MQSQLRAFPDNRRERGDQRRERIELLLGPQLLAYADSRVRDDDSDEERVPRVAEDQRDEPEREQDRVERRGDVRTDDARGRAARCLRLDGATRLEPR